MTFKRSGLLYVPQREPVRRYSPEDLSRYERYKRRFQPSLAFALIANTAESSATGTAVTTSGIDTTGADLIAVIVSDFASDSTTLTDSKSNTWTPLTPRSSSSVRIRIYYSFSPSVGTGHTFTGTSGGTSFPSLAVLAFSGAGTSPFDQENGTASDGVLSLAPGSVTPTADNEVLVAGLGYGVTDTVTIDEGFTISNQLPLAPGVAFGIVGAYKIQTTAGAQNPTFNWGLSASNAAAAIGTFKSPAVGGAFTGWNRSGARIMRGSPRLSVF